jgi:hypothetical protein
MWADHVTGAWNAQPTSTGGDHAGSTKRSRMGCEYLAHISGERCTLSSPCCPDELWARVVPARPDHPHMSPGSSPQGTSRFISRGQAASSECLPSVAAKTRKQCALARLQFAAVAPVGCNVQCVRLTELIAPTPLSATCMLTCRVPRVLRSCIQLITRLCSIGVAQDRRHSAALRCICTMDPTCLGHVKASFDKQKHAAMRNAHFEGSTGSPNAWRSTSCRLDSTKSASFVAERSKFGSGTITQSMPAAFAAATPVGASSNTRHASGCGASLQPSAAF